MNRADFRLLAEDRMVDAVTLLAARRWSCAYYIAGYAVECGLKSCIITYLQGTDTWQKSEFSKKCWNHDLKTLMDMAELTPQMNADCLADAALDSNWNSAKDWNESSRYEQNSELEARTLVNAISDPKSGVLTWVKQRW